MIRLLCVASFSALSLVTVATASARELYSGTITYKRSFVVSSDGAPVCEHSVDGALNERGSEDWRITFRDLTVSRAKGFGDARARVVGRFAESLTCVNDPTGEQISNLLNRPGTVDLSYGVGHGRFSFYDQGGPGLRGTDTDTSYGVGVTQPMSDFPNFAGRTSQRLPGSLGGGPQIPSVSVRAVSGTTTIRDYVVNWQGIGGYDPMNKTTEPTHGQPGTLTVTLRVRTRK